MEEKVSLLEKTITNSINKLFSDLPFGAIVPIASLMMKLEN